MSGDTAGSPIFGDAPSASRTLLGTGYCRCPVYAQQRRPCFSGWCTDHEPLHDLEIGPDAQLLQELVIILAPGTHELDDHRTVSFREVMQGEYFRSFPDSLHPRPLFDP